MRFKTPQFIQRIIHGGNNVATVNATPRYRITLKLGEPEMIFTDDRTTKKGKAARLQVLGLMKRPLSHDQWSDCTDFCWNHFKRLFSSELPAPHQPTSAVNDAEAERILDREVKRFWISGGTIPGRLAEARLRLPGDYTVLWRKGDDRKNTEPLYALDAAPQTPHIGANRYAVEQKFFDGNPGLGQIPIIAEVERFNSQTNQWEPAPANTPVYFQLVRPPAAVRTTNGNGNGWVNVAGASTWAPDVAPKLRDNYPVRATTMPNKSPKGRGGPRGYHERYVTAYGRGDSHKADPQADNAHWHLGGKRGLEGRGRDLLTSKNTLGSPRSNIFASTAQPKFHSAGPTINLPQAPGPEKKYRYSVKVDTNANGVAGVIFQPSRIGGDRYQLRVFVEGGSKTFEALTGVMTRWRTVRFCMDLVMEPSADASELPANIVSDFTRHGQSCAHSDRIRYCAQCVLKDGPLQSIDYAHLTREFARAWCELLIEPRARTPTTFADVGIQADMTRMRTALAADVQKNKITVSRSLIARGDGNTTNFQANLAPNLQPGVELTISPGDHSVTVGNDGTVPPLPAANLTGGNLNHGTGALTLTFGVAPPSSSTIEVEYTAAPGLDLERFLYFPNKSPFLLNFRSVEGYAATVQPTFAPPRCERSVGPVTLTSQGGGRYTGQLPQTPVKSVSIRGDAQPIADRDVAYMFDELGGAIEVQLLDQVKDEVIGTGDGITTVFQKVLNSPMVAPLRSGQLEVAVVNVEGVGSATVYRGRTFGDLTSKGNTVAVDVGQSQVTVTLTAPLAANMPIKVTYSKARVHLPQTVDVTYTTSRVDDQGPPSIPDNNFAVAVSSLIEDHLLMAIVRAVDDNRGYMPGIILVRGGIKSTWSLYKNLTDQGKGIANGVILYGGNIYNGRKRKVTRGDRIVEFPLEASTAYTDILLHEAGHSLYVNHFDSGSAAGPRNDLHDMYDVCLMGYGSSNLDLCGQCVAGYMGMNIHDQRFKTYSPQTQHIEPDPAGNHGAAISG